MMLQLPLALAAFMVGPPVPACVPAAVARAAPSMGLFDGLKDAFDKMEGPSIDISNDALKGAFENDPRLAKDRNVNAGKTKNAKGYVKQKEARRQRYEAQNKKDTGEGDRTVGELFSGWKW